MVAGLVVFALFVVFLAVRSIVAQSSQLAELVSAGLDVMEDKAQQYLDTNATLTSDTRTAIASGLGSLGKYALGGVLSVLPATVELLSAALLTVIILFFLLKEGRRIWEGVAGQFPHHRDLLDRLGARVWEVLRRSMAGTTLIAAIDAVGIGLGMMLIGVPFAASIGFMTFLLAYIPIVGATVSGAFGVLLAIGDGDLSKGLAALAVVLIVQQIEGNVLQPFIMGMFLAVPLVASAAAVVAELRASGVLRRTPSRPSIMGSG
jgi:predicted PurR-regulated permease PerM